MGVLRDGGRSQRLLRTAARGHARIPSLSPLNSKSGHAFRFRRPPSLLSSVSGTEYAATDGSEHHAALRWDLLGDFIDLLPLEELQKIKPLILGGIGLVANVLRAVGVGGFSLNLDELSKKLAEKLKNLDPPNGSRDAINADIRALQATIENEVIPFLELVRRAQRLDDEAYALRLSIVSTTLDLLNRDLQTIVRRKRSRRRR